MLAGLQPGAATMCSACKSCWPRTAIPSKYRGAKYPLLRALNQERDLLKVIDVPEAVSSAAFSPDGTRIVSGSTDKTVRLWDAATGQPIGQPLRGHDNWVTTVAFSPDGTRIASAGVDGTIRLWDAATGQPIGQPMHGDARSVASVAFSPDGTRIASAGLGRPSSCGTPATGQPIGEPLHGHDMGCVGTWRSAPTAPASPRPATTRRSGYGTPATGQPDRASRCAATTRG